MWSSKLSTLGCTLRVQQLGWSCGSLCVSLVCLDDLEISTVAKHLDFGGTNSAKRVAVQFIPIGLYHLDPINHGYGLNKWNWTAVCGVSGKWSLKFQVFQLKPLGHHQYEASNTEWPSRQTGREGPHDSIPDNCAMPYLPGRSHWSLLLSATLATCDLWLVGFCSSSVANPIRPVSLCHRMTLQSCPARCCILLSSDRAWPAPHRRDDPNKLSHGQTHLLNRAFFLCTWVLAALAFNTGSPCFML